MVPLGQDDTVHAFLETDNQPEISLVLLCHSVPEASRITLCAALKKSHPKLPILMLHNGYDLTVAAVDGLLENLHSPEALVEMINMLVSPSEKPSPLPRELDRYVDFSGHGAWNTPEKVHQ